MLPLLTLYISTASDQPSTAHGPEPPFPNPMRPAKFARLPPWSLAVNTSGAGVVFKQGALAAATLTGRAWRHCPNRSARERTAGRRAGTKVGGQAGQA
jgi:hypothetical protein